MDTIPYWADTAQLKRFPKLARNLSVDVVVIGGGITGLTAAYLLKKSGATVALLERGHFADVDSGHTTAHLTYVTDSRFSEMVKNFGRDHAQAVWDAGDAAIRQIDGIVQELGISCEFKWVPGYLHMPVKESASDEKSQLEEDARLAAELGFDALFMEKVPFMGRPGIRFANQAKFHPRKYAAGLLQAISGSGSHLFEQTGTEEIQDNKDKEGRPLSVKANGHTIECAHVVIATHVPLQGMTGTVSAALFQTKLATYTSYVLGAKIPSGSVPEASFWDTGDPYDYLRVDRHDGYDYAIFGGNDHKTGQTGDPRENFADLERRFLEFIPGAVVDHHWSGQVIETNDGLPFMGETAPRQFVATGFSGNGMTFGTLGAMMACDAWNGRKNPWSDLFDVNRKMIRTGAWDYLKENKDYPYCIVKQKFEPAEGKSSRGIKPGEGKVLQLKHGKVAAYRDEAGELTMKSAVCPHMGCIVRWNSAEKTWDCPCHGSRFKATGEVLAGPAETSLPDVKKS